MMSRLFTYLLAACLFALCLFSYQLVPDNLSDQFLGIVKRNLKKERKELLEDMKEISKQGLIYFEIYDEAGQLITTLKQPIDFEHEKLKKLENLNFTIKSVTASSLSGSISLPSSLP